MNLDSTGRWADYAGSQSLRGIIEVAGPDTDADGLPDGLDPYPSDPHNAWDLREAGPDHTFDTADDVIYRLTLATDYTGGTSVSLFTQNGPLPSGHYRFTANTTLTDVVGNALDGNGDGVGGDPYQQEFTVALPPGLTLESGNNDTLATATTLPLAEDPAGSGLFTGRGLGRQDPAGSAWSDPDYWRFEALAGDVVSISVDTPESNLNPYVELHNAADQYLIGDDNAGPDNDAFISHYIIPSSGSYYVKVGNYSATPGSYELRVDLARGMQLESDACYSNDSIAGANALTMSAAGTQQQATVAGTVMAPEGSNTDEDYFALGALNVGNQVELNLQLPAGSTLNGMVTLVNSSGAAVADTDGNPADGHFLGTIAADGAYYAKVQSLWSYNGHSYLLTDGSLTWSQAEAYAQSLGGHLVTVNDAAEQQWLTNTFGQFGGLWIGFYQTDKLDEPAGHWAWMSGETATYTNWAPGEPNNANNTEDYGVFNWDSVGRWNDYPGNNSLRGLIELNSAGTGVSGAGPYAQYLLDVDVTDLVPPRVTAVTGLPAAGTTTDEPVQSFTVSLSEALDPATAKAGTRMVWSYDGHFYTLTQSSETWSAAETEAQALGGDLATVNDAAEQQWLTKTFGQLGWLWIGYYQTDKLAEPAGHWAWASGETSAYTNWAPGDPNNGGNNEDNAFMNLDSTGRWADYSGNNSLRGIIEVAGPDTDADGLPDGLDPYPSDPHNAWDLREAGPDHTFDTADDVIYRLTLGTDLHRGDHRGLIHPERPPAQWPLSFHRQ